MNRLALSTLLLLAASGPALAQASKDASRVPAGTYTVDPDHTQIVFSIDHFGFSTYNGVFSNTSGKLDLTPQSLPGSKLEISVPIDSVHTTSDKLTGELKSADWFDAQKFPQATFTSTALKKTGSTTAEITGNLTLHGVTKPVVLHARFYGAGLNPIVKVYTAGFEATGKLKRSDFGVTKYVPYIGDEVTLSINAAFVKP